MSDISKWLAFKMQELKQYAGLVAGHRRDSEYAHRTEKEIWGRVLNAIASGHTEPQKLAAEALKTKEIEFSRWFA